MASETWQGDDAKIVELVLSKISILQKYRPLQKNGDLPASLKGLLLLCPSVCKMVMANFLKFAGPIRLVSSEKRLLTCWTNNTLTRCLWLWLLA
jgi:hypothetical protein